MQSQLFRKSSVVPGALAPIVRQTRQKPYHFWSWYGTVHFAVLHIRPIKTGSLTVTLFNCTNAMTSFLANVNCSLKTHVHVRYLLSPVRLSVVCLSVCNARAPCLSGWNFRQYFYGTWYLGYQFDSHRKLYGDRLRRTHPPGELNTRGVVKYSDFGPIEGYISETVQDRR